ncbi:dephospho-CoA kinase [Marinitoga hydrogenitolerans DSM 16785]|uniref:Dephospho-CoA kinase n=1 Tax=Marinitoga hydrogenitolerans (strain DSM 16785 / JCM 12826 / AT1271) TaxID=1122195 RepID=A0A1M4XVP7_MARH1|nr:dephospho-CoA kinase [Marinitoga hydrogenitolerans]SHE97495.1 dephospho-CoA kinase [Marinitoga hydrogenitolerans DSM 16785]
MKIIGITGYAGSGKSTIAKILKSLGYSVVDLDKVGHEILKEKKVKEKLKSVFGEFIFEKGEIKRDRLSEIVFKNNDKLELLNNILHPIIKEKVKEKIKKINKEIVFIDGALIEKIGLDEICDYIIFVESSEENRLKRLTELRKMPLWKAEKIINSQKKLKYKYNFKIVNNNGLYTIKNELLKILHKI